MLRHRKRTHPAEELRQGERMGHVKTTLPGMPRGQRLQSGILNIEMHTSTRFPRQHVREGETVEMMIYQNGEIGEAGPQSGAQIGGIFPDR